MSLANQTPHDPLLAPAPRREWQPGNPVVLRPHNILCLQGWQGMGYSPLFTANMDRVHGQLRTDPSTLVTLQTGPDVLCGACPLDTFQGCQHDVFENGWITAHDGNTLGRTGLTDGETYPWAVIETAIARAFRGADLATFCHQCRWQALGVCAAGIEQLRSRLGVLTEEEDSTNTVPG